LTSSRVPAPEADEYGSFYSGYVALIRERDPVGVLQRQPHVLRATCVGMSDPEGLARYAPEKWSIKEVLGHLTDVERIHSYRLFRVSRGDATPLPGFDENDYVRAGRFEHRAVRDLLAEFETVRSGTLRLVENVPPEAWSRRGEANGYPISARALLYIMAGHVEHHFNVLRERYGLAIPHIEAPPA